MRNSRSPREKYLPTVRSPNDQPSIPSPALQHFHHFHVVRIGRIIVVGDLIILLGSLENQRNIVAARVLHQPLERLLPYQSVPYENVAILVRSQLSGAVVEMEE